MLLLLWRLLLSLLSFVLLVQAQFYFFDRSPEDDFVHVDFKDCKRCEHNFKNYVFLLKGSEGSNNMSVASYRSLVLILWLCLAAVLALRRWRK